MSFVKFTINGKEHNVSNTVSVNTSLNEYLRYHANLRGTKAMCHEGGCGACIVSVSAIHPVTNKPETFSVNSCLVPILSCHGWAITTIEGIGNKLDGYHPIQTRLAAFNGTQCGYCSPGWVMNMHSLKESRKDNLTMLEVENSFAGNICRCTGYRPIIDAFKTLSKDCDPKLLKKIQDIEELSDVSMCAKTGLICTKSCDDFSPENGSCSIDQMRPIDQMSLGNERIAFDVGDSKWFKVYELNEIFDILDTEGTDSYMLVAGNTAQGIYHVQDWPKVMIDVKNVAELRKHEISENIVFGGNMTLKEVMDIFQEVSKTHKEFSYTSQMYHHLDLVAHMPVRNVGTIAGNLSIKHQHQEFQSDIFIIFETVGATLSIAEKGGKMTNVTLLEYLSMDMKGKVIHHISIPPLSDDYIFQSYKIMPRAQNAHAHVNAGFLLKFNKPKSLIEKATIVYGGITAKFNHATETENFIAGKDIFNKDAFKLIIETLEKEISADYSPPEPSPEYRNKLAVNLFYKFILHISPADVFPPWEKSGGEEFNRPVSSGKQEYDTNKDVWPLNKPISKLESLVQCSGEAKFINDLNTQVGEVYAAFVLSTVHNGTIDKIYEEEAKLLEGVIDIFTAKDIPGKNSFSVFMATPEEILSSGKITFYGQPVALIVAETEKLANLAAAKVKITYKDVPTSPPVLSARDGMVIPDRLIPVEESKPTERGDDVVKVIKGSFDFLGQYHYTMETQSCVCVPMEDGVDVYPASQWMDMINCALSEALNIPENRINIHVRRLGGGYGGKITRPTQIAAACCMAAIKLNRPVRLVMPLESNMAAIGKRNPYATDYEIGVNGDGKIQYLVNKLYSDAGHNDNDCLTQEVIKTFNNCYDNKTWNVHAFNVITDTPTNTSCRAPVTTEGVAMIENIMEHIAMETGKDAFQVRVANMALEGNPLPELMKDFMQTADFEKRSQDITLFNADNRWKKRGISMVPLQYKLDYFGNFAAFIAIYYGDGTVSISHGGIEMGQGLNTKVAQVCAHALGIEVESISIKPSNNHTAPNAIVSGGSISSESCCYATLRACEILLERLAPIRKTMDNPSWVALVQKAHLAGVDLSASHMFTFNDGVKPYNIWGTTIVEVEVDMLTGNHQILRVDILEDTGESLSPEIDVGQVEGAFIMGLGYWTSEKLMFDKKTGALLTNRTWNYKPPGIKDIPIDFRVSFRRNAPNPCGVLRSKAAGEPPLNMAIGVPIAIRNAITAAKLDSGFEKNSWYHIEMPCTAENILLAADLTI